GETLHKFRLDLAVRHRTDVQQEIGIRGRGTRQVLDERSGALEALVTLVVSPSAVDGFASFQRQIADLGLVVESLGAAAGKILLEHLEIFARIWRAMVIVSDQG